MDRCTDAPDGDGWNRPIGEGTLFQINTIYGGLLVDDSADPRDAGGTAIAEYLESVLTSSSSSTRWLIELSDSGASLQGRATLKTYPADLEAGRLVVRVDADQTASRFYVAFETESTTGFEQASGTAPTITIPETLLEVEGAASLRLSQNDTLRWQQEAIFAVRDLVSISSSFCAQRGPPLCVAEIENHTLLDIAAAQKQPDVDTDSDGLERTEVDDRGRVARCLQCDKQAPSNCQPVAPTEPDQPWTCGEAATIQDAFRGTLIFVAAALDKDTVIFESAE